MELIRHFLDAIRLKHALCLFPQTSGTVYSEVLFFLKPSVAEASFYTRFIIYDFRFQSCPSLLIPVYTHLDFHSFNALILALVSSFLF